MARIVTQSRGERRAARYKHLRILGFSAEHARRYRDQSSDHIIEFVDDSREEIVAIPAKNRSESQRNILKQVRKSRRRENQIVTQPRLKTIGERSSDFSRWSEFGNVFPGWALKYIEQQNADKGLSPADSYGYRRFYWSYVEGRSQDELGDVADRGDSEIR